MDVQQVAGLIPILLMGAIFYFGLYRPQKVEEAKRKAKLEALKRGDEIITIGGIFGTIQKLDEKKVWLEIGETENGEKIVIVVAKLGISGFQDAEKEKQF
mgnify:FL=1